MLQSTPTLLNSKRPPPSPASQPTTSQSSSSRPKKRPRLAAQPLASSSTSKASGSSSQVAALSPTSAIVPAPVVKRERHGGSLRRLAHSRSALPAARPQSTLSGAKIGGRSKDLKLGPVSETKKGEERLGTVEEMWIGRRGMTFAGWLKKGVAAFVERGIKTIHIHAMAAAMPMALSLALAIRDAVSGGPESLLMDVKTGSIAVADEVTPEDEDLDIIYQTRLKSTIAISLTAAAMYPPQERTTLSTSRGRGSDRGSRRRGQGRGGRGGKL